MENQQNSPAGTNQPVEQPTATEAVSIDFTVFLAEEEIAALRSKIKAEDRKTFLEATPGNDDIVVAYIVHKARKEAKDKIFSDKRTGYVFDLLKHQVGLLSKKSSVQTLAHATVVAIAEECDAKQCQTLAGLVRKENLAGKTAMAEQTLAAFTMLCGIMSVDPESLK